MSLALSRMASVRMSLTNLTTVASWAISSTSPLSSIEALSSSSSSVLEISSSWVISSMVEPPTPKCCRMIRWISDSLASTGSIFRSVTIRSSSKAAML